MKYHELKVERQTKNIRVGRGISAGRGKTAGRGTKGQGARKSPTKTGFEGGQTPLHMRLPKLRGFKSHRPSTETIYTGQLDNIKKPTIDNITLAEVGLVSGPYTIVKLIVNGELKSKKTVKLQAASASAVQMVKQAGGSFEKIERQGKPKKNKKAD